MLQEIKIESILGGHSPLAHFGRSDQYRASLGIDPSLDTNIDNDVYGTISSGLIRPVGVSKSTSTTQAAPLWIVPNPKVSSTGNEYYIYDAQGSAYSITQSQVTDTLTALSDGGSLSSSIGNGCAYYDNYIYFAKNTDIARYGPLNGTAAFDGTYWTGTLGKAALTDTTYPVLQFASIEIPNHVMLRHSDGRLYIADVVGNQGTLHYIETTKTTVEGDTNNGSTASKLTMGYGLWPTALESYGSDVAIALFEGSASVLGNFGRAKIAFWDTTSTKINKITWVEFPDPIITAMKNINGVLYIASGNSQTKGFRISRFIGGYTVEEVGYFETGFAPLPGAVDGRATQLILGSITTIPETAACVYSFGLRKGKISTGIFNVARADSTSTTIGVTSLIFDGGNFAQPGFFFGAGKASSEGSTHRTYAKSLSTNGPPVWWSQTYRIGRRFKIKKIRIPLPRSTTTSSAGVVPKIYFDDGTSSKTLQTINATNYPTASYLVVMRPDGAIGQNNFFLEFKWNDVAVFPIGLPITMEIETIDET